VLSSDLPVIIFHAVPVRRHSKSSESHGSVTNDRDPNVLDAAGNPATVDQRTNGHRCPDCVMMLFSFFGDLATLYPNAPVRDSSVQQLIHILRLQKRLMFSPCIGWMAWFVACNERQTSRPARSVPSKLFAIHSERRHRTLRCQRTGVTPPKKTEESSWRQLDFDTDLVHQSLISAWKSLPHSVVRALEQQGTSFSPSCPGCHRHRCRSAGFFQQGFGAFKDPASRHSVLSDA